jgi:cysteine dioxygenase
MTDALQDLCMDLRTLLAEANAPGPGAVADRLAAFAADPTAEDLWRPYALFTPGDYTRNLIHREETFELVLLVWDGLQVSTIHDHAGQEGWSAVLEGEVKEEHFRDRGLGRAPEPGPVGRFHAGQVSNIRDEVALHRLGTAGPERAVTLHLYAGPVESCTSFGAEDGERNELVLAYDSIHGETQMRGGLPSAVARRKHGHGLRLPGLAYS